MMSNSVRPSVRARAFAIINVKLPRFRGQRTICVRGVHDVEIERSYAPEFRRQLLSWLHAGRTPKELVRIPTKPPGYTERIPRTVPI